MKEVQRVYKVWGYPFVPAVFVIFTAFFLVITLVNDINHYQNGQTQVIHSVLGILITLVGLPIYYLSRKK